MTCARRLALGLWLLLACTSALPKADPPSARDLHETVERVPVTARDRDGIRRTVDIELTLFRPAGDGPFPLAVVNHGRGSVDERRSRGRARFEALSRYLVSKGFVVALPTRIGYGASFSDFDPEGVGPCRVAPYEVMADAAADQVLAVVALLRNRPGIDASRWLVLGQSVGGVATLAVVARNPPGLVAAVNFAGGAGGSPARSPGQPCAPDRLAALWSARAGGSAVPTLWLYWLNDRYWGEQVPRQWLAAWKGGGGRADFHQLPAAGNDGHAGMNIDMDHWVPLVEPWLAGQGLGQPHPRWPAAPSGHARIDELDKLPLSMATVDNVYRRFLAAEPPRAFAIGANGAWGWSRGDWAAGRALANCQRNRGLPCALYAVDDTVVWVAPAEVSK